MAFTDAIKAATLTTGDPVLSRLLERARCHSAEFGHMLANHLPMMLVALRRMGASDRRLEEWFETYRVANALAPPPASEGRIDRSNWLEHRGDRSFEGDYRAFFAAETQRLGIAAAQATYLPDLVPGIAASALHAMMRLAYANDRDDPAEIATALGYWAAMWLPLRSIGEATPQTDDPAALLSVLRERMASVPIEPPTDLLWHWMREVAGRPEFPPVAALLEAGPSLHTRIASASLALMAGTMTFEALHAVTGAHWIRMMKGRWPEEGLALRYFWQAIASVYPKIGLPELPDETEMVEMRALACPDWPEIHAKAVASDDEHDVSFAFSTGEEARYSGDRLYRVLAARRVGLLP